MTILEQALIAVRVELKRVRPILEGLQDYDRLNITPDTRAVIRPAIAAYEMYVLMLEDAARALEHLINAGFPCLPLPPVLPAVYADLVWNRDTIQAALDQFTPMHEAQTLSIEWGAPEDSEPVE